MDFGAGDASVLYVNMPDAVAPGGLVIDFKTSESRTRPSDGQMDFLLGNQWAKPRGLGKAVTPGKILSRFYQGATMHNLPVDEYRWARAMAEVMHVPPSYYVDASPEAKRERERVLEYLAQFDTHQGFRAAAVVVKRVQLIMEGEEPRPRLAINKIMRHGQAMHNLMQQDPLGKTFDGMILDEMAEFADQMITSPVVKKEP